MAKPTYVIPHVTWLEKFRRVMAAGEGNTWDTEASLYETITDTRSGNDKTALGTAFHKLVELNGPEAYSYIDAGRFHIAGEFAFTAQQAQVAYDYRAAHPNIVSELPVSGIYTTPRATFQIEGTVDVLEGTIVRDIKTRYSAVDVQAYLDSYQWRFYLDMLGLTRFYYDVFEVKGFPKAGLSMDGVSLHEPCEGGDDVGGFHDGIYRMYDITMLRFCEPVAVSCYAYAGMQTDLHQLLNAFAEWLDSRNYWHLLPQRTPSLQPF